MANPREYPNVIPGLAALDLETLHGMGRKLEVDLPADGDAEQLAALILRGIEVPARLGRTDMDEHYETIGIALGLGKAADWKSGFTAAQIRKMHSYQRPSYEQDVIDVLMERHKRVRPEFRQEEAPPSHAREWPELATRSKWSSAGKQKRAAVARALARALGDAFEPEPGAGDPGFARVRHRELGLSVVAICGGTFEMGLRRDEVKGLTALAKALGSEEAHEHAKSLRHDSRPTRRVKVAPFLLARTPLLGPQAARLSLEVESANPHQAARVDHEMAPQIVARLGARLPSEAEWEWVARAGNRTWLSGDEDTETHAGRVMSSTDLDADASPWGILGLMWSEWVDDGWHSNYKGAPADARAWEPRLQPETARGGLLDLWPWQVSEAIQCHVTVRSYGGVALHGVRPAWSLPGRAPASR